MPMVMCMLMVMVVVIMVVMRMRAVMMILVEQQPGADQIDRQPDHRQRRSLRAKSMTTGA